MMDHVNIARVLDAGTVGQPFQADSSPTGQPGKADLPIGRPYFVMELVHGVPITKYCDDKHLTPRERLELFMQVCQAIQHAHQKGIIHRDIKPSNVMITLYDGKPVPKVIDFGVAKATEQKLTERSLFTQYGTMVGTLEYMSPEQAEMSALSVDTRSDIYSLGVLLYELLTGSTPLSHKRVKEAAFAEVLRMIKEEEPPKPSTRLSDSGEALMSISAQRDTEPAKLTKLVRGELDWIVMKTLEKDRNRRYETASAFAADVQRYLHDEPVLACPPSAGYRLRKFARRNKRALATAALLGVMLLVAVGALAVSYVRTNEALGHETQAREDLGRTLKSETRAREDRERALEREQLTTYLQSIALAERQLSAGNVGRAEEFLNECSPELRRWEWHFLKRQRYGNPPPLQHPETVAPVAFSPDGRQIASGCLDGLVRVWDAQTGKEPRLMEGKAGLTRATIIRGLAWSPDGRYLAVAKRDGLVVVWNAASGEVLATLQGHEKIAWQVAFSPDGRTLASASADGTVRLWNVAPEQGTPGDRLIRILAEHPAEVRSVAFRSDGRHLVSACLDGTVKVWDVATGREASSFHRQLRNPDRAWFSPDGRRLAWTCLDSVINVWDGHGAPGVRHADQHAPRPRRRLHPGWQAARRGRLRWHAAVPGRRRRPGDADHLRPLLPRRPRGVQSRRPQARVRRLRSHPPHLGRHSADH
jgi:hypothetical protein